LSWSGSVAGMSVETELRDGEVVLRPPAERDLAAIVAGCRSGPDMPLFLPLLPSPYGEEDGRAFLASVAARWRAGDPERTYAIADGETDELLGIVSIRLYEGGTVGYWLRPEARGRGIMTRAVRLLVDHARREHGIERLRLFTHPDNLASQRVAERAGFRRVGLARHEPPFRDGTTDGVLFELP